MGLKELCEARGTSGREEEVRELVRALLPDGLDGVRMDALGNLFATRGAGRRGPHVLLLCHLDEVGLMVSGHTGEGYLRVRPVGGVDAGVLAGKPVRVGSDAVPGAIGIAPHHLVSAGERRAREYRSLFVDVGARSAAEARELAPVGEMITFDTPYTESAQGDTAIAKAFDDRVGVFLALEALGADSALHLTVAFTVQEEVGLRGAQVATRSVRPDLVLVLEATAAGDTPETPPNAMRTEIGRGPALTSVDRVTMPDRRLTASLLQAAQRAEIPWQWRRSVGGGNDAGAVWPQGYPVAAMSIPCRYLHSPASLISLRDLRAARDLLVAWLETVPEVFSQDV